jgi:NADH-quinone oxidoreductase subunit L
LTARDLLDLAWILPALPAAGAAVLLLFGKRIGEPKAGWLATIMMALAFGASVVAFLALYSLEPEARDNVSNGFTWFQSGGFVVDFRFLVDPLSSTMTLFVTGVGTLIHLYAIGYMHGDERYSRFFAYMNLFAASMLVLVLGSSFLLTFVGWEGVGLCSYLLISFWFERNSAAVAGKKAFVTNRVGDFGFMLAMFLIFSKVGTLDYLAVRSSEQLHELGLAESTVTAIALLLTLGAIGKSAQVPLHIWLPDAMEGPTPVSALIHAATMVTAGVFLVVRAHAFFDFADTAPMIVAWIGAITALFAATVALVQNDIKRVLAYSTISQLGYMFLAAGLGAYTAAMFHMITHAFFKALLFLCAGAVIHSLRDEQDMRRMGALRKFLPFTFATFIVGWLSIAGVFPFSGFWSKDEILGVAWFDDQYALWAVGLLAALLTAFYMTRQVYLVFYGDERWRDADHAAADPEEPVAAHAEDGAHGEPHEAPWTMTVPLIVLAVLSTVAGLLNLPFSTPNLEFLGTWLEPSLEGTHHVEIPSFAAGFAITMVALVVAIVGIIIGRAMYLKGLNDDGSDPAAERLGGFANVLANGYYLDVGLARFVTGPVTAFARLLSEGVDRSVIDGAVNGVGTLAREGSQGLRRLQTGLVRNYALAIVFGTLLLLVYVTTRASF